MKIYLAGPMRGVTGLNRAAFAQAAEHLRRLGNEVFNPGEEEDEASIREIFRTDCDWICREADVVALLPGWEASKGAIMEKALAHAIGIPVLYL